MSFRDKTDWLHSRVEEIPVKETEGMVEVLRADDDAIEDLRKRLKQMADHGMLALLQPVAAYLDGRRAVIVDGKGKPTGEGKNLWGISRKSLAWVARADMELLLANFWGNPRNVERLLDAMPAGERALVEEEVRGHLVSEERAKAILGKGSRKVLMKWTNVTATGFFEHLPYDGGYRRYYTLHYNVRNFLLRSRYSLDGLIVRSVDALPQGKGLLTFSGEDDIIDVLEFVRGAGADVIDLEKCVGRSARSRKDAARKVSMREFFSASPYEEDLTQRTVMVIDTCVNYRSVKGDLGYGVMDCLVKLFGFTNCLSHQPVVQMMLCHLKGLRRHEVLVSYINDLLTDLRCALTLLSGGRWMELGDFRMLVRLLDDTDSHSCVFDWRSVISMSPVNKRTGETVRLDSILKQITIPFIQGYLFLLAAFGLVEVAYSEPRVGDVTCFSRLRYVRLTTLGLYVLGLEKEYVPVRKSAGQRWFEADADRLILRSLSDENPYASLVGGVGRSIGGGRYLVTAESLLGACKDRNGLKQKIDMVKSFIGNEMPDNWSRFFDGVTAKCGRVTEVDMDKYEVWDISPEAHELHRIVSSDALLRKYTLRADRCMLLVERKHKDDVVDRLKSYGYLADV